MTTKIYKPTEEELKEILANHKLWLKDESKGKRANLFDANLSGANLESANLSDANLERANLFGANLFGANLFGANLFGANLESANLSDANLERANLSGANLFGANLFGANLDFSAFPLWCGSKGIITDTKLVYQLLAHVHALDCKDEDFKKIQELIKPFAKKSHRWNDLNKSKEV